jgi:hypothetical protein
MSDIVLTGIPRGGTTLACRLLGGCRDTVALFEPIDIALIPAHQPDAAARYVEAYFASARRELREHGWTRSKVVDGKLPDNPYSPPEPDTGVRRLQASEGSLHADVGADRAFTLVIKHNAAFTALLPFLQRRFVTVALVRNPLAALASWHSLDLPVSAGRLPAGERFDPALAARLLEGTDLVSRQLRILDWFFSRYADLGPDRVVAYEDLVATQGRALFDVAGLEPVAAPASLQDRNLFPACRRAIIPELARRLLAARGAWERWYPSAAIADMRDRMLAAP